MTPCPSFTSRTWLYCTLPAWRRRMPLGATSGSTSLGHGRRSWLSWKRSTRPTTHRPRNTRLSIPSPGSTTTAEIAWVWSWGRWKIYSETLWNTSSKRVYFEEKLIDFKSTTWEVCEKGFKIEKWNTAEKGPPALQPTAQEIRDSQSEIPEHFRLKNTVC